MHSSLVMMRTYPPTTQETEIVLAYRAARPKARNTTAETVAKATGLNPRRVIAVFRSLVPRGLGSFVIGRHGGKSRFVWAEPAVVQARPLSSSPPSLFEMPIENPGLEVLKQFSPDQLLTVADFFMRMSDTVKK